MNPILRVLLALIVDPIVFFILAFVALTSTADESNGFWGISAAGVGLMIGIPAAVFIAIPSGFILGLLPLRILDRTLHILVASGAAAALVLIVCGVLLLSENTGKDHFLFSVPFFATLGICFLSNLATLGVMKLVVARRTPT